MRLDAKSRDSFLERIGRLEAGSRPLWGRMDAVAMLAHLRRANEIALEEVPVEDESTFARRNLMRPIVLSGLFPIPKGKVETLPAFLPADAGDFEAERSRCIDSIRRFVAKSSAEPDHRALHPAFGSMPLRQYQKLFGLHVDHHLRQFGV